MKRSRPLRDQGELQRLLDNLPIGKYPNRVPAHSGATHWDADQLRDSFLFPRL